MPKDIASLIQLTSVDSSTLSDSTWTAINPDGLPYPCFELRINNASTTDVTLSTDATNPYEYVMSDVVLYLHAQNNPGPNNQKVYWPKGTIFYAQATAGTGDIYLSGSYNPL